MSFSQALYGLREHWKSWSPGNVGASWTVYMSCRRENTGTADRGWICKWNCTSGEIWAWMVSRLRLLPGALVFGCSKLLQWSVKCHSVCDCLKTATCTEPNWNPWAWNWHKQRRKFCEPFNPSLWECMSLLTGVWQLPHIWTKSIHSSFYRELWVIVDASVVYF